MMKFAMGAGAMPAGFTPKAPVKMPLMRVGACVGTLTLTPDGEAVVEITDPALQAEVMETKFLSVDFRMYAEVR